MPLPPGQDVLAPRLARAIIFVIIAIYAFTGVLQAMVSQPTGTVLIAVLSCVLLMYALQLWHCLPGTRRRPVRYRAWTLSAQALITFGPLVVFDKAWIGMNGPLAGSLLLLLPSGLAWPLALVTVTVPLTFQLWIPLTLLQTSYLVVSGVLGGLVFFGLSRLSDMVREIHTTRSELARMAVTQERLRFARDLHDLLGYSLSAITLKSELTHRLVLARPERAREEIDSILRISRQALADVRLVANSYRDMSLPSEAESAKSMLEATGIETQLAIECGDLHPAIETVLATALREGVTNILRHSKVQHCVLEVRREASGVRLTLLNDGVPGGIATSPAPHSGSGLGNLAGRLSAVGGALDAGVQDDGTTFRLSVWAPQQPVNEQGSSMSERSGARRESAA